MLKDKAAHHAISAKFPKKIDNKGKDLVVQYEVKLQGQYRACDLDRVHVDSSADSVTDGLECGGAYMKLLKDTKALQSEEFSNASPYVIMFGPDKCGSTNKVGQPSESFWSRSRTSLISTTGSFHFQAQEPKDWRV